MNVSDTFRQMFVSSIKEAEDKPADTEDKKKKKGNDKNDGDGMDFETDEPTAKKESVDQMIDAVLAGTPIEEILAGKKA